MPWLVRRVLWPAHERLRGRATPRLLRDLRAGERLPLEAIEQQQVAALRRVLAHAAATTPYYRRLFDRHAITPETIRSLSDLERVPVLTKALVRAHGDDLVDPASRRRLSAYATSGSTGEPLQFFIDRRRTAADNAARARAWAWWGLRPGDRQAVVWGSSAELHRHGFWRRRHDRLFNLLMLPATELSDEALGEMVRALARFRPRVIFGYASALGRLAEFTSSAPGATGGLSAGVSGPGGHWRASRQWHAVHCALRAVLRLVVATAEPLLPHHRRAIAAAFGCGVATEYGARECGILAGECPRGSLHIAAENALIEVVDAATGRVLPPGETGDLAVTLLGEYGMPMIRYLVGDVGQLAPGPCGCGLGLPVLAGVEGRRRDVLRLDGERRVHPSLFSRALAEVRGLSRFRVVQTARSELVIQVCADDESRADVDRAIGAIREELGPGVSVTVKVVDVLPSEASGKFRWVVGLPEAEEAGP